MKRRLIAAALFAAAFLAISLPLGAAAQGGAIAIRTEQYPRPPYSGATYYIYERGGQVICTKLLVCNKFNNCETTYRRGAFKAPEDVETGAPYGTSEPVPIPAAKLSAHACLTKFRLL